MENYNYPENTDLTAEKETRTEKCIPQCNSVPFV